MPAKTKLAKAALAKYQQILVEKRARITGDVEQLEQQTLHNTQRDQSGDLSDYSYHMADVGSDAAERETMLGLASKQQSLVDKIDRALERIEQGSYGVCSMCASPIPDERLKALPEASACMKCMKKFNL